LNPDPTGWCAANKSDRRLLREIKIIDGAGGTRRRRGRILRCSAANITINVGIWPLITERAAFGAGLSYFYVLSRASHC
jgi:hypothetical protein